MRPLHDHKMMSKLRDCTNSICSLNLIGHALQVVSLKETTGILLKSSSALWRLIVGLTIEESNNARLKAKPYKLADGLVPQP